MDFPHHHNRRDEDEFPPPGRPHPPSYYDSEPAPPEVTRVFHSSHSGPGEYGYAPAPPPPQATNVYHSSHSGPGEYGYSPAPPPPQVSNVYHSSHSGPGEYGYAPAPPPPQVSNVYHSSHSGHGDFAPPPPTMDAYSSVEHVGHVSHHSFTPHMPSFMHHHSSHNAEISNKPSVRMYSKAEQNYSLTIRDGKVILAPSDPSDPYQHWIKDEKYSTRVKDEEGFPSFALVNKATGQAMKHSIGATQPVQLIPYNPDVLDESILWTESRDLGDTYRTIRMVNNIRLNVDAFNGDRNHGGVRNGTPIVLWEWKKGDNQRWKIVPY